MSELNLTELQLAALNDINEAQFNHYVEADVSQSILEELVIKKLLHSDMFEGWVLTAKAYDYLEKLRQKRKEDEKAHEYELRKKQP